jgi:hypothetical protein
MRWLGLTFVVGLLWAQGEGRTVPPADDPTHPGQPRWCQSDDRNGYVHNCSCKGMTDEESPGMCKTKDEPEVHGDPKCRTFCRRNACGCHQECSNPTD